MPSRPSSASLLASMVMDARSVDGRETRCRQNTPRVSECETEIRKQAVGVAFEYLWIPFDTESRLSQWPFDRNYQSYLRPPAAGSNMAGSYPLGVTPRIRTDDTIGITEPSIVERCMAGGLRVTSLAILAVFLERRTIRFLVIPQGDVVPSMAICCGISQLACERRRRGGWPNLA
ncbi:hypothetical protein MRX96_054217 [Rhipicephalus microplus]